MAPIDMKALKHRKNAIETEGVDFDRIFTASGGTPGSKIANPTRFAL